MNSEFMIGIFNEFSLSMTKRILKPWFSGIEVSYMPDLETAKKVSEYASARNLFIGIHYPLVAGGYKGVKHYPLMISPNTEERKLAFDAINLALSDAIQLNTKYILFHFPFPRLLIKGLDWPKWRIKKNNLYDDKANFSEIEELSFEAFEKLSDLSRRTGVKIVLEHDALHPVFYEGLLGKLFSKNTRLGLCVDTARLHMMERTDSAFNGPEFIKNHSEWITNIHLWNMQFGSTSGLHHPVLPDQLPENGWGGVERYFAVFAEMEKCKVLFEHNPEIMTDEQLNTCYNWTRESLINYKNKN